MREQEDCLGQQIAGPAELLGFGEVHVIEGVVRT